MAIARHVSAMCLNIESPNSGYVPLNLQVLESVRVNQKWELYCYDKAQRLADKLSKSEAAVLI